MRDGRALQRVRGCPVCPVTAERLEDKAGLGCEPSLVSGTQALAVTIILEATAIVPAGGYSYPRGWESPAALT